jgi:hypothetical protein
MELLPTTIATVSRGTLLALKAISADDNRTRSPLTSSIKKHRKVFDVVLSVFLFVISIFLIVIQSHRSISFRLLVH